MSIENAIVVSGGDAVQVGVDNAAMALRNEIVSAARCVVTVTDREGYALATEVMKAIKSTLTETEKSRKLAKGPVDEIAKRIQEVAKSYCEPLEAERQRIGSIIIAYEQAELRKRLEAERKQREEAARIQAEADKKAREAAAAAAKAALEQSGSVNRAEEAAIAAVNDVRDAAALKIAETKQELANSATEKAKGFRRVTVTRFEIVDEAALRAARADLFSPDESKIRAALKITKTIPGLKVWEEVKM